MKIEKLRFKNKELFDCLLPLLVGNIFHVSNGDFLESILKSNEVKNNKEGTFPYIFPQSKQNYGARTGSVCLIDLTTKNIMESGKIACDGYYFLNPRGWSQVVFLILDKKYFKNLKKQDRDNPTLIGENYIPMSEVRKGTYIPEVECWYPDKISLDKFSKILIIDIINSN